MNDWWVCVELLFVGSLPMLAFFLHLLIHICVRYLSCTSNRVSGPNDKEMGISGGEAYSDNRRWLQNINLPDSRFQEIPPSQAEACGLLAAWTNAVVWPMGWSGAWRRSRLPVGRSWLRRLDGQRPRKRKFFARVFFFVIKSWAGHEPVANKPVITYLKTFFSVYKMNGTGTKVFRKSSLVAF